MKLLIIITLLTSMLWSTCEVPKKTASNAISEYNNNKTDFNLVMVNLTAIRLTECKVEENTKMLKSIQEVQGLMYEKMDTLKPTPVIYNTKSSTPTKQTQQYNIGTGY